MLALARYKLLKINSFAQVHSSIQQIFIHLLYSGQCSTAKDLAVSKWKKFLLSWSLHHSVGYGQ